MSTEFISILPPPGESIKDYDRTRPPTEQAPSVPPVFLDVMKVREEVFVKEQNVALERELDSEDQRCYHWIVYASVGAPRGQSASAVQVQRGFGAMPTPAPSINLSASPSNTNGSRRVSGAIVSAQLSRSRSASTASRTAVGTIRLIPPHIAEIGSRRSSRNKSISSESVGAPADEYPHPTISSEPYIRLGRLATLSEFRGLGLAKLLVNAALQYARQHPDVFVPRQDPAEVEAARLEGRPVPSTWNGLVIVHAQKGKTDALWKKWGFTLDEGMGTWDEEGMDHVGMWKRLEVVHS